MIDSVCEDGHDMVIAGLIGLGIYLSKVPRIKIALQMLGYRYL
jgi:hypothetical protein